MEFGPQLIGQTEKALNAVLQWELSRVGLSEPQWVTLRLTQQWNGAGSLAEFVSRESHLDDAAEVVLSLECAGLLTVDRQLTPAGQDLMLQVQAAIKARVGDVWATVDPADAAAAARALTHVREHCQALLVSGLGHARD